MALEITKTFTIKASAQAVWDFLIDVERVAKCMPGAAIAAKLDDKTYTGTMTVKVGPVTQSYKGKIVFEKLDAAARSAEIVATGQDIRGKGGADMRLSSAVKELGPSETEVTAVSQVNITGIMAQMGRGMIKDVSDQLFGVFSQRMRAELESAAAASAPVGDAPLDTPAEPAAVVTPAPPDPKPAPVPEVLDLGPIGARAAKRATARLVSTPGFWLGALAVVVVVYLILR